MITNPEAHGWPSCFRKQLCFAVPLLRHPTTLHTSVGVVQYEFYAILVVSSVTA